MHTIAVYLRHEDKTPYALLVARNIEGNIRVGFSVVHKNDKNNMSKRRAWVPALSRLQCTNREMHVPFRIQNDLKIFLNRCNKYFQDANNPIVYEEGQVMTIQNRG